MNHIKGSFQATALLLIVGLTFISCDKVQSVTDKYKSQDEVPETTQLTETTSEPQAAMKKQDSSTKPLAANELARVGSWRITMDEFNQRLDDISQVAPDFQKDDPDAKALILEELVRQRFLIADAKTQKLDQKDEIASAVDDFQNTLLIQEVVNNLTGNVNAAEEEAKTYYDENQALFIEPVELKVREILVYDEAQANDILVQLLQGGDFAEIAKAQSKAKSKDNGGDLGYISQAPSEQMQKVLIALEVGKTSSVFKGPEGFYIVKVEDRRGGSPRSFDTVKKDLIDGLTAQKKQQAVLDYLQRVSDRIPWEVNNALLEGN